ncbi:MAG TPA: pseudouridine synthase [Vicinamibacterales bacterium]|nr:pseudouridine synthase [Vicinamibacterales bacterium]
MKNRVRRSPPRSRASSSTVPLNRALSKLGLLSRAQATGAIIAGRIRVDGRVITDPRRAVVPERVRIAIDDAPQTRAAWRALVFHKPRGVVTTRHDPAGRRTIYDVLGESGTGLVAVGRLDLATSGLLILTTDTQLANRITDPANAVPRVYLVTVRGEMTATMPGVTVRKRSKRETHLVVELHQGRNREIRKMFATIGHEVTRLKRVSVGGLELGDLEPGQWRELTRDEIRRAFP